ncbi:MAG TPA: HGGxSTG domain-containing protein [Dongiaceae bacterium]|nr:HGGxSTG domain-containing protein [Dongiaceae bacterium]
MPQAQPHPTAPAVDLDTEIPAILASAAAEGARLAPAIAVEIAHAHVLMMQLAAAAKLSFDRIAVDRTPSPACRAGRRARRLAEASGQAMDSVRLGALALQRLALIGRQRPHRRARPPLPAAASLPPARRGRLKNGNPAGDYLAAPRCGAKTRCGGCCRQPAMANGRCRMHGGRSTGPRTAPGLSASRRARFAQGDRSAAALAIRAVANAARSLARLQRVQARFAPLLETQQLPSTPCQAERVPLSRETGERQGVRVRAAAPLCLLRGTVLTPTLSRPRPELVEGAGEGSAPAHTAHNPSHSPSTPCQAVEPPRHSFPWKRRPAPPMFPPPGLAT